MDLGICGISGHGDCINQIFGVDLETGIMLLPELVGVPKYLTRVSFNQTGKQNTFNSFLSVSRRAVVSLWLSFRLMGSSPKAVLQDMGGMVGAIDSFNPCIFEEPKLNVTQH